MYMARSAARSGTATRANCAPSAVPARRVSSSAVVIDLDGDGTADIIHAANYPEGVVVSNNFWKSPYYSVRVAIITRPPRYHRCKPEFPMRRLLFAPLLILTAFSRGKGDP